MDNRLNLVVCPIYNEADYVAGVLEEIQHHVCPRTHILAVNDGSNDGTREVLDNYDDIIVMHHKKNLGYGKTLIDGFDYAIANDYRNVITIDCDWQHQPRQIEDFCKELDKFDIVSGSRYLKPSNEQPPENRYNVNMKITKLINEITGYGLTDAFCGFKAYHVDALKKLKLTERDYGMPVELWLQAHKHRLTVEEIPVALVYFDHSRHFPDHIRDDEKRLKYYLKLIAKETSDDRYSGIRCTSG